MTDTTTLERARQSLDAHAWQQAYEGFGSLDPDTLETVAGTIENLGAGDRTVAVVTHVRELAERMPVQYRVTKGPRTAAVDRVLR